VQQAVTNGGAPQKALHKTGVTPQDTHTHTHTHIHNPLLRQVQPPELISNALQQALQQLMHHTATGTATHRNRQCNTLHPAPQRPAAVAATMYSGTSPALDTQCVRHEPLGVHRHSNHDNTPTKETHMHEYIPTQQTHTHENRHTHATYLLPTRPTTQGTHMHDSSDAQDAYLHEIGPAEDILHENRHTQDICLHRNGPTHETYPQEKRPIEDILHEKIGSENILLEKRRTEDMLCCMRHMVCLRDT